MNTEILRGIVQNAARTVNGRIWPNGLGFDRGRAEYTYNERELAWQCLFRDSNRIGFGDTPQAAHDAAVRRERSLGTVS